MDQSVNQVIATLQQGDSATKLPEEISAALLKKIMVLRELEQTNLALRTEQEFTPTTTITSSCATTPVSSTPPTPRGLRFLMSSSDWELTRDGGEDAEPAETEHEDASLDALDCLMRDYLEDGQHFRRW